MSTSAPVLTASTNHWLRTSESVAKNWTGEAQRWETPMDSSIRMTITGSAFTESVIPIDSSTVITVSGVKVGVEGVVGAAVSPEGVAGSGVGCGVEVIVGSTVGCGVGVGVKIGEGGAVSCAELGADSGWAQANAMPNSRAISPRRRRVVIGVRERQQLC